MPYSSQAVYVRAQDTTFDGVGEALRSVKGKLERRGRFEVRAFVESAWVEVSCPWGGVSGFARAFARSVATDVVWMQYAGDTFFKLVIFTAGRQVRSIRYSASRGWEGDGDMQAWEV